ncbi:MAG TPA: response regulator [Kofleriaceae bacterium]|nr:response regulator [Kofleriaceae bacterium]
MAITILHTGQTGVERGACRAARLMQLDVAGFSTFERRDELGHLSNEIAENLIRCSQRGVRSALRATLETANAVVLVLSDVDRIRTTTGVASLQRQARLLGIPCWIVDQTSDLAALAAELRKLEHAGPHGLRVLVTGPRFTRWPGGHQLGMLVVSELALAPAYSARRRPHRILVVDDHTDTARTTCVLLRALGHEGHAAVTGLQGLELAAQVEPDIGLFDIGLPDITGYELAGRLRARRGSLFLAAITGWEQAMDASRAIAAGFDRHVIKPAGAELIQELIKQADAQLALAG